MKKIIFLAAALLIAVSACSCSAEKEKGGNNISAPKAETETTVESVKETTVTESAEIKSTEESTVTEAEEIREETENSDDTTESEISFEVYFAPLEASSIEEYYNSSNKKNPLPECYVLKNKPENAEISDVTYREGVYVSVHYYIPLDEKYNDVELDEYSKERMTEISCVRYLFEDGEYALKVNVLDKIDELGYQKVEVNGIDYYYTEEHSLDGQNTVIGYQVEFSAYGQLFLIHLPPLDTFENMYEYLEIVKA